MVNLKRNEFAVAIAALALLTYTLTLSVIGQVASQSMIEKPISNTGSIKAIGLGVYWDQSCVNEVSLIDWGILESGSSVNATVYIRNEGNSVVSLSMNTSNWSPSSASNYIALSWDYGGGNLDVDEVIGVTFTLSVSPDISGITSFSFDIVIVASDTGA